jgi:PIN domain nuclease of toxin-antitoxin system
MTVANGVLLDTCALIWLANGDWMTPAAVRAIVDVGLGGGIHVSPISAWEIGMLSRPAASRGRALDFLPDAKTWFGRVPARPGIRLAPLSPEIVLDASFLPEPLHVDPADRLLIATARHLGMPIATRDGRIAEYAAAGHLSVLPC